MSQTITYKTKYKSLNAIKKVIDGLAERGAFGANVEVHAKGEPGFNPGLFRPNSNQEVIFVVRGPHNSDFFKDGFYEKGFAIAIDRKTNEISIVYDYRSGGDAKVTEATRKKLEEMIESNDMLNIIKKNLSKNITGVNKNPDSETDWSVNVEFTPEELKNFLAKNR